MPSRSPRVGDKDRERERERRASSCRKAMGEKRGVEGVDRVTKAMVVCPFPFGFEAEDGRSEEGWTGKESCVEVTRMLFSTARRYLPTDL